jgi:hypothetical protein
VFFEFTMSNPSTRIASDAEWGLAARELDARVVEGMLERAVRRFGSIAFTWTLRCGSASISGGGGTTRGLESSFPSPQGSSPAAGQAAPAAVAGGGGGATPAAPPPPNLRAQGGPATGPAARETRKKPQHSEPQPAKAKKRRRKSASARRRSTARAKDHRLRTAALRRPPVAASSALAVLPGGPDQPNAAVPVTTVAVRAGGLKRVAPDDDAVARASTEDGAPSGEPRPRPRAAEAMPTTSAT